MALSQFVLLVAICALNADAFSWKNCASSGTVKVRSLSLSPTPVKLEKGSKLFVSGSAEVTGDAGVNYRVDLTIKRKLAGWFPVWVKVPCYSNVGSCSYSGITCSAIWKNLGKPETCPVPQGPHSLPTTTITVPEIDIPSFLTSGEYWVEGKLTDTDKNKVLACIEIDANIA